MDDKTLSPLDDSQAEGAVGGYIFDSSVLTQPPLHDESPWEVLDYQGNVVVRFSEYEFAHDYAWDHNLNTDVLNWDQVQKLRETGSPY